MDGLGATIFSSWIVPDWQELNQCVRKKGKSKEQCGTDADTVPMMNRSMNREHSDTKPH